MTPLKSCPSFSGVLCAGLSTIRTEWFVTVTLPPALFMAIAPAAVLLIPAVLFTVNVLPATTITLGEPCDDGPRLKSAPPLSRALLPSKLQLRGAITHLVNRQTKLQP